jgi:glycine dehydrogenase subunit 1
MDYIPHTDADVKAMLKAVGVKSVAELFRDVPEAHRFPELNLDPPTSQMETGWELESLSETNVPAGKLATFLGAGVYNHYSPAVINAIIQRGEFLTAYTPYQPELSQGTLEGIFEYQSMIVALTGMEIANASHYDGATALAEAVIMALSVMRGKRKTILFSPAIHPEYREVARTYTQGMGLTITGDEDCKTDLNGLAGMLNDDTAMLAVQYPNFFGQLEDLSDLAARVHEAGAMLCVVADPIALGLFKPPGEMGADIVVGEGQSLGIPMNFGGPYLGFFATHEEHARKTAGRLVGETVDTEGKVGYVLTLSTREQHIKRERATSNICTNQGLMALAAAIYMSLMGKHGLRKVAELCYHKAHYAADLIDKIKGYKVDRSKPFFKEFVVHCPWSVDDINMHLLEYDIIGGYDLSKAYPNRPNQMLIAVTEMNTREEIEALAEALAEVAR